MAITMKEIANWAGVSTSTVSRVISGDSSISENTRNRVMQIINENNYVPSSLGRNLRKANNKTIMFMMPTMTNSFYAEIFRGVEETADKYGYEVLACVTNNETKTEEKYLNLLTSRQIDGIISAFSTLDKNLLENLSARFPYVQVCEHTINANLSYVSIDNESASYEATSYLIKSGHKNIALISGDFYKYSEIARETGYKRALNDGGLAFNTDLLVRGHGYQCVDGYEKCRELFNGKIKPTSIFCVSDTIAIGVLKYLHDSGLKPGVDVDVIGFDNIIISSMSYPSLSTISQPQYLLGSSAMNLLFKKITNLKSPNQAIHLSHELVLRDSTSKNIRTYR